MNQQEILKSKSTGKFVAQGHYINSVSGRIIAEMNVDVEDTKDRTAYNNTRALADAEALVTAYNETFGNSINPEAVEGLLKALQSIQGLEPWISDRKMKEHFQKTIYSAIEAAKL